MHWDGSSWTIVTSPNASENNNFIDSVVAVPNGELWAVGGYITGGTHPTLIEHYSNQFGDVLQGSTFYPYVRCLACRGILSGYFDGTFRPNNSVTRGQLSRIVSNAAGFNNVPTSQTFEDVPPGSTFYTFTERVASRNIISGYPCGGLGEPCGIGDKPYFRVQGNASRGQIAKIATLASQRPIDTTGGPHFTDVPVTNIFYSYIETLYNAGILTGYPDGTFRPGASATRGQTSKLVSNTFFPDCDLSNRIGK
jgi:hypothetical protein